MRITNKYKQVKEFPTYFEIIGEPASKANSREWMGPRRKLASGALVGGSQKSKKAKGYVDLFNLQCPILPEPYEGDVFVIIEIFYASRRPDLDESLILDLMQGKIYKNDRQVKGRMTKHNLDRENPRCRIYVFEYDNMWDPFKHILP